MIAHWPLTLIAFIVAVHAWEENVLPGVQSSLSPNGRPRKQRRSVNGPSDTVIAVDHNGHGVNLHVDTEKETTSNSDIDAGVTEPKPARALMRRQTSLQPIEPDLRDAAELSESEHEEHSEATEVHNMTADKDGLFETLNHEETEHVEEVEEDDASEHEAEGNTPGESTSSEEHLDDHEHDHADTSALLEEGDASSSNGTWWSRRRRRRAIPCRFSSWGGWSGCSKGCGGGTRTKRRSKSPARHGGRACPRGPTVMSQKCNTHPCPVACRWSGWSSWGSCSKKCGGGRMTATRKKIGPYHGGHSWWCRGPSSRTASCNTKGCPQNCYFQAWSQWGACSRTCTAGGNEGLRYRTRGRVGPFNGGKACRGSTTNEQQCNSVTCPTDCQVHAWASWSSCSQSCSVSLKTHGYKTRTRVERVAASNGGRACPALFEMVHCNTHLCPFDCSFTQWGAWGPCSKTCTAPNQKAGVMLRIRDKIGPGTGGKACRGPVTGQKTCNDFNCPQDCEWNAWGPFSACSKTCDIGGKIRKRTKKPAKWGGKECVGMSQQTEACATAKCPMDCKWSLWEAWMPCSKTCGGGLAHRSRSYDPRPMNGGKNCVGAHMEMMDCMTHPCPTDCQWEQWLDWGLCSASCGSSVRTRVRLINITGSHGGKECSGDSSQESPCPQTTECPLDCRFGEWTEWGACNATCGSGHKTKTRTLRQAENGGVANCPDGDTETAEQCEAAEACPPPIKAGSPSMFRLAVYPLGVLAGILMSHF